MDKSKAFVTLPEAAAYTGRPYGTLYRWAVLEGRIPSASKSNGTTWVISVEDMERIEKGELR